MELIKTDVLVIGGGGAGCRAAVAAADAGADVLLVLKKRIGNSGATTHKCCEIAGYNVPGCADPADSVEEYYHDMMDAALGMANEKLARILAENVEARFQELRAWGVSPAIQNGRETVMKGCYSRYPRGYAIPGHGGPIVRALKRQLDARGVRRMENTTVVDLIVKRGGCRGALVLGENGLTLVAAGAVILATGGAARVFSKNLNPEDVSGDGYSLAYDHGAVLTNLEFMQAGIGFFHPVKSLFNTYLWAGFPKLTNRNGDAFLEKYLPQGMTTEDVMREHCRHFPFSSRDISRYLEIGLQKELNAGGGTDRMCFPVSFSHFTPAYLDGLREDAGLRQLWPMVKEHFKENDIDLLKDRVEVTCVAQAVNGGVLIDGHAMSSLPGLFAAGETAAGPHGADRLGGNMMGACQVFGEIAGREGARFTLQNGTLALSESDAASAEYMTALLHKRVPAEELRGTLQRAAQENLFICRTQEKLDRMAQIVDQLGKDLESAPACDRLEPENLSLYHLINSARLMTIAASSRKESRGSHYREDYPEMNSHFGKPGMLQKGVESLFMASQNPSQIP